MTHHYSPVVILSASEWRDNPVSTMHIAAVLSESRPVLFVETPGNRMPKWSEIGRIVRRLRRLFQQTQSVMHGLHPRNVKIYAPFAIPLPNNPICAWFNRHILLWQIKRQMRKLKFERPWVWAFSPLWWAVIQRLTYSKLIFHCVDALHTYNNHPRFQSAFNQLAVKANIIFTPGKLLHTQLQALNPNAYQIGHGCGEEHLRPIALAVPEKIKSVTLPKIVYAGCLANWVDYDLLYDVANRLPQYAFLLIGYIHGLAPKEKIEKLVALKNVFHIGYINYAELPAYYRQSVAGIIPYQSNNEHIYYSTPTKILDYMAAGLPCISTHFPAANDLGDYVLQAHDSSTFAAHILAAVSNDTEEKRACRCNEAKSYSWESQVKKMLDKIDHTT